MEDVKPRIPVIRFDGSDLGEPLIHQLASLRVESSVYRPATVEIVLEDPDRSLFMGLPGKVGTDLEVLLPGPGKANALTSVFKGHVTGLGVDDEDGISLVRIEGHDRRYEFALHSGFVGHLDRTPRDVVETIIKDRGMTPKVEMDGEPQDWILQWGTEYAAITRLAAAEGCEWYVEGKEVHVAPARSGASAEVSYADGSLRRFSAHHSTTQTIGEVEVRGWDPVKSELIVGSAKAGTDEALLGTGAEFASDNVTAAGAQNRSLCVTSHAVRTTDEARTLAEAIVRRFMSAGLDVEGEVLCNPAIQPGGTVEVAGVAPPLVGAYQVTEVVHEFGEQQETTTTFVSRPEAADLGTGGAVDVVDDLDVTHALTVGVVTDVEDDQGLGRVKLKLPTLGDDVGSDWARVLSLGGGQERGLEVLPEINDEVLVAFAHGDPRYPIVLGGLHSDRNKPSDGVELDGGEVTTRAFTSRSGHRITLSDGGSDDTEYIELAVDRQGGAPETLLQLRRDEVVLEAKKGNPLTLRSGDASITLTDRGEIEIAGNAVTIKTKQQDVAIDAKGKFTAKGMSEVSLESKGTLKVKGAMATLEGDGIAEVKAKMVKIN